LADAELHFQSDCAGQNQESRIMNQESIRLVLVTFPDLEKASQVGAALVESQIAACVNLLPAVESIYRWQGQVETAQEVLAIFKTTSTALAEFEAKLTTLHPYEVPEMIALEPQHVAASYARWVGESVS
jgi:periplasmic divalent cation tolerance protein